MKRNREGRGYKKKRTESVKYNSIKVLDWESAVELFFQIQINSNTSDGVIAKNRAQTTKMIYWRAKKESHCACVEEKKEIGV